jgi:hypothetical protein
MDDIGLFGLNNIKDLFKKLEREYNALMDEVTTDGIANFVITADSLFDWVEKDKTATGKIRKQFKKLKNTEQYKLINDMANRAKHYVRKEGHRGVSKDKLIPSWDFSNLDFSNVTFGEPIFEAEMNGKSVDIMNEFTILFENIKRILE